MTVLSRQRTTSAVTKQRVVNFDRCHSSCCMSLTAQHKNAAWAILSLMRHTRTATSHTRKSLCRLTADEYKTLLVVVNCLYANLQTIVVLM